MEGVYVSRAAQRGGEATTDFGKVDGLEGELPETLTTVDSLLAGSCYSSSSELAADSVLRGGKRAG